MSIASRHMPTFLRQRPGVGVWLFLTVLGAALTCIAAVEPTKFAIAMAVLAVLFGLAHIQTKRERAKLLLLARGREGRTICEFAREFDTRVIDTWIIRAVYEQLQAQLAHIHPAFPIHATDRLKEDLLLEDDALDMDVAQQVKARTGRSLDNSGENPHAGQVRTVRDLVLFFQSQPRTSSVA